ncbi:MAG: Bicarbonate transport ATP-binding protein CmpD [Syntrophorhabdaceae bacterium PtaU1.Bin034]|nr:MAG: Bicarbonate transport ATP-binding protein CmpD [Syntrophorhabdaceae bacterium PtaU1.Bin034]
MLRLKAVRKMSGKRCIIERADLTVAVGEIFCLAGPSGIGKTTLLEIMAGLLRPDAGKVVRGGEVSLAFQDDVLLPWLSARGNMEYALSALPEAERSRRAYLWLERFGLTADQFPGAMSGGMRRRLNLARAFSAERSLLLLDEPYAFLDSGWQGKVTRFIASAAEAGVAVVLASHQLSPLSCLGCRIVEITASPVVLDDGRPN